MVTIVVRMPIFRQSSNAKLGSKTRLELGQMSNYQHGPYEGFNNWKRVRLMFH